MEKNMEQNKKATKKTTETATKQPKATKKTTKTAAKQSKTVKNNENIIKAADPEKVREAMKRINTKKAKEPKNFWSYIKALHAIEGLSEWLPLEAMPLMPFVEKKDKSFVFYLLFVTPSGKKSIGKPWGMAALALPEAKVLSKIKFDKETFKKLPVPETKMLCNRKFVDLIQKAYDENGKIPLPPKEILDIYAVVKTEEDKTAEESKPAKKVVSSWSEVIQYMNNLSRMLKEDSQEELLNDLVRIKKRLEQPLFSVAVVGEFSRGKSTFINNLFGKEFLPVGDLPTTAMLTKIVYGKKQRFFRFYEGIREEISAETLENLVADDNGNDPSGVILAETPFNFLNKNGIQFIDTPGAGDIFGKRAAITTETIASCDATILTVSATMPLSLTEKSFVEDNIFLKAVPRVAVVVTRLDQVPEKEREKVYEYIKLEVGKWQKDIPVWVSGINIERFGDGIVFGKDEILKEISKWVQNSDNDKIRMQQIYTQTNLIKEKFAQILKERENILKTGKEEYAKQLKKEEETILNQDTVWEDIALEIEKREVTFGEWLREILDEKTPDIKEDILFQAKNCPDPQKWWSEQFPYIFKRKIQGVSKELSAVTNRKLATESESVAKFVREKFGTDFVFNKHNLPVEKETTAIDPYTAKEIEGGNLETQKKIGRFAYAGAFIAASSIFGPLGMFAGTAAALFTEKIIKDKVEKQREQVTRFVDEILSDAFENLIAASKRRASKIYLAVAREIRNEQKAWLQNVKQNFKRIENSDIAKELADVERKIANLSQLN